MKLAPIVLFVFNRPEHTRQTLQALANNDLADQSELYIFADGARGERDQEGVKRTRACIRETKGFKAVHIVEQSQNLGLAKSIIKGVTEVMQKHGRAIVLEDDILTSKQFLSYMNHALIAYNPRKDIFSVNAFNLPPSLMEIPQDYQESIFLNYRTASWGWGGWYDRWKLVDWEVKDFEKFSKSKKTQRAFNRGGDDMTDMLKAQQAGIINSWWIRFCYAHFKYDAYAIYPVRSYVNNIGHDGSGVHCDPTDRYYTELYDEPEAFNFPLDIQPDMRLIKAHNHEFHYDLLERLKRKGMKYLPSWMWNMGKSMYDMLGLKNVAVW